MKFAEARIAPTNDELLTEILDLRRRRKRPLSVRDLSEARKNGECSPLFRFIKAFGSLHLAIAEAGAGREPLDEAERERRRASGWNYVRSDAGKLAEKSRLLIRLRQLHEKLGKPPEAADIDAASNRGETLSFSAYQRVFGSLQKALSAAGIPVQEERRAPSRTTMVEQLKNLAEKLGRMPRSVDIKLAAKRGETAPVAALLKEFGSFSKVYQAAGWTVRAQTYSDAEVAESLRELTRKLGRFPRQTDVYQISAKGGFPSLQTIRKRYGSLGRAAQLLGLDRVVGVSVSKPAPHGRRIWTEDEIIESLRALTRRLERSPRYIDVDEASRQGLTPSTSTLENRFGTFNKALKAARAAELVPDLPPDWSHRMMKYTKKDVVRSLRDLAEHLGHVPTLSEINESSRLGVCPSENRIIRKFGSLEKARRAAGLYEMIGKKAAASGGSIQAKPKRYTEGEVFEMLRRVTRRLGHVPTAAEIEEAAKRRMCPSVRYLRNKFQSVVKAREWAELSEVAPLRHRVCKRYSKEEIIQCLQDLRARLGRAPRKREVDAASQNGLGPSVTTIRHHFGTFSAALAEVDRAVTD